MENNRRFLCNIFGLITGYNKSRSLRIFLSISLLIGSVGTLPLLGTSSATGSFGDSSNGSKEEGGEFSHQPETVTLASGMLDLVATVNVSDLDAAESVSPLSLNNYSIPFLTPDLEAYESAKKENQESNLNTTVFAAAPDEAIQTTSSDSFAETLPARVVVPLKGWNGLDNFSNLIFLGTPPDPQIAAGPNHVFEMVNVKGQIWTKQGSYITNFFLFSFFKTGFFDHIGDPKVLFDSKSGRWFASIVNFSTGDVRVAVSKSDNSTGSWNIYNISFDIASQSGNCPDQPIIGVNDDKFVVSVNLFTNRCSGDYRFIGAQYFIIDKQAMVLGLNNAAYQTNGPDPTRVSVHPVNTLSPSPVMYMVSTEWFSTNNVELFSITGSVPNAEVTIFKLPIQTTHIPPDATQPRTTYKLNTNDARVLDAVWYQGKLWLSLNDACTPPGDIQTRSCLRLIQIFTDIPPNNNNPSVIQDFDFGAAGYYYFYPALSFDTNTLSSPTLSGGVGNLDVIFGYSSSIAYPSLAVSGQALFEAPNTLEPPITVKSGNTYDGTGRYGDYFGAGVDPADSSIVWFAGEYTACGIFCTWRTHVQSVTQTYLTLSADNTEYHIGDPIFIYGRLSPIRAGEPISVKVFDPSNVVHRTDQIPASSIAIDGFYSHILRIEGPSAIPGNYRIEVSYGIICILNFCVPLHTQQVIISVLPKPVVLCPDSDNDGICDNIDIQTSLFSSDFSDIPLGDTTFGSIINRGDQPLSILDEPNPDGVRVVTSGNSFPVELSGCGGLVKYHFKDATFVFTCNSVDTHVISGNVIIQFFNPATANLIGSAKVSADNSLVFDEKTLVLSAPASNTGDIVVNSSGKANTLLPGGSLSLVDQIPEVPVGGLIEGTDMNALLIAGLYANASWLLPTLLAVVSAAIIAMKAITARTKMN